MKKYNFIETVDECLTNGVNQGVFHLSTNDDVLNGRTINIKDKDVVNFGSCSYLGLEMDRRLKDGAINATEKYGTQFSSSRAYLSCGLYEELEDLFTQIFENPAILAPSTTLAHIATIPVVVSDNDLVILDHQVHGAVQNAVQLVKARGVKVEIIRHSRLDALEELIKKNRDKYEKIWYMIDGVYSMYGDFAPIADLIKLQEQYPKLNLYIDDAHGMSWTGKYGRGYILSQIELNDRILFTTSLAKGFGTGGGVVVSTNKETIRKIKTCGSSFVFSGPIQPPMLGASIASAKLHLTDEIYTLQDELKSRVKYFDELIKKSKLPYIYDSGSPIVYIGLGLPKMGYNIVNKLIDRGFYVDIGIFPGVPVTRTGLRLTINNNVTYEDIENVIDAISEVYPQALIEEDQTIEKISKYFRTKFEYNPNRILEKNKEKIDGFTVTHSKSIKEIDKILWNKLLENNGSFGWDGCLFLEKTFTNNPKPENNWEFHYIVVEKEGVPIVATFLTVLLSKDDMPSPEEVSKKVEEKRAELNDPYYLTSKVVMMGSLLTEGEHLYLDRENPFWREAMEQLIEIARNIKERTKASSIYLRDFDTHDEELKEYFIKEGFFRVDMPDTFVHSDLEWDDEESYLQSLSSKSRYHVRRQILDYEKYFTIKKVEKVDVNEDSVLLWEKLYMNVKETAYKMNTFALPRAIFENVISDPNWEIFEFYVEEKLVSVGFNYEGKNNYCPIFLGFDYDENVKYNVYRQMIYHSVKRARELKKNNNYMGMTADMEKSRIGAKSKRISSYVMVDSNYTFNLLETYR